MAPMSPGPKPFTPGRLRISFNGHRHQESNYFTEPPPLIRKMESYKQKVIVLDDSSDSGHLHNQPLYTKRDQAMPHTSDTSNLTCKAPQSPLHRKGAIFQPESNFDQLDIDTEQMLDAYRTPTPPPQSSSPVSASEYILPFSVAWKPETDTRPHGPNAIALSTVQQDVSHTTTTSLLVTTTKAPPEPEKAPLAIPSEIPSNITSLSIAMIAKNMPPRQEAVTTRGKTTDCASHDSLSYTRGALVSPQLTHQSPVNLGLNANCPLVKSIQLSTTAGEKTAKAALGSAIDVMEWQPTLHSLLERLAQLKIKNEQFANSIIAELDERQKELAAEQAHLQTKWNTARGTVIQLKVRTECDLID
ncbi:hypothetical protein BDF19DRAFT_448019 [Syncephalis fuscata]|nr:hypothetical protein BDF19DRAFT_448019 [Syncephalis fuscata]